jgi:DNA topoisomerase-2
VPCYNPAVLKDVLEAWLLAGGDTSDMSKLKACNLAPWYRGFTGRIESTAAGASADYTMTAKYEYNAAKKTVRVTDLPVGYWTSQFKHMLDAYCEKKEVVKDYTDTSTDTDVNFEIVLYYSLTVEVLEKTLGLVEKIKTTNMHAFDPAGVIKKYATPNDILVDYALSRMDMYVKRKAHLLSELNAQMPWHSSVVKFLTLMCEDKIDLRKKSADQCRAILASHDLQCIDDLLKLPFSSVTEEQIAKREAELEKLRKQIAQIERTAPNEFWLEDLCGLKV